MAFQIIRQDITKVSADAIVNTANPMPVFKGGTDRAIYIAAGAEELLEERKKIGKIEVGQAAVTPALRLRAKYIIHTVGPEWVDGKHSERELVRACYENSLSLAKELGCESIAFPLISTGIYGFPKEEAIPIAVSVFSKFLSKEEMKILLVVFDEDSFALSGKIFEEVDSFIDENYAEETLREEYRARNGRYERTRNERIPEEQNKPSSLEDLMAQVNETWQESLFRLIDEKGCLDPDVYKRANVDRKLFSKIRCNKAYQPKKITAVAFALALELDLQETKDFLARAGYALSPSSRFDLIIEYFIKRKVYDTYTINLALFEHDQPLIGE